MEFNNNRKETIENSSEYTNDKESPAVKKLMLNLADNSKIENML